MSLRENAEESARVFWDLKIARNKFQNLIANSWNIDNKGLLRVAGLNFGLKRKQSAKKLDM